MKVLHISYSVGRSSANTRLHYALLERGIDSKILTLEGDETLKEVYKIESKIFKGKLGQKWRWFWQVIFDKIFIIDGMPYHMGVGGKHIEKERLVKDADIVHLHWVCDFASPKTISRILSLGKPVVWTCHDSWPFTGGCNVKYDCIGYQKKCNHCFVMKRTWGNCLTEYVWKQKRMCLGDCNIQFIAPSAWIKNNILQSSLFGKNICHIVHNALDLKLYDKISVDQIEKRLGYRKEEDKIHILFGATSIHIPYKGFRYLLEMLNVLYEKYKNLSSRVVLHVLGEGISRESILDRYECKFWGYIDDEEKKVGIYNVADLLIYPSLEDNLPSVVMESLACFTPAVVFNTGGIPDLVEHKKNGYIAKYKDSQDLLNGLIWCIENNRNNYLGEYGRKKIEKTCSSNMIAEKHIQIYRSCMEQI